MKRATNVVEIKKIRKLVGHESGKKIKMKIIHKAMADILKPLDGCGGVSSEVRSNTEEKCM